jgi:hypothetical protein
MIKRSIQVPYSLSGRQKLNMMEDWIDNTETKEDYQKQTVMQNGEEFQHEEKLDEYELMPAQGDDGEIEELVGRKMS